MRDNIAYWFHTRYKRFLPIVKAQLKDAGTQGVFLVAGCIIIPCFIMMMMSSSSPMSTNLEVLPLPDNAVLQGDSVVRKGKKATTSTDFIHAGADEKYPDAGYDEHGWSNRGYMSSYEMAGKHCKSHEALVRFEQRKAQIKSAFVDSMGRKAIEICKGTDVPPSIVCAQAIIETNFGTSRLKHLANNMFGHMYKQKYTSRGIVGKIKAYDKNVKGKTLEYNFRVYESVWWSMRHHVELLEGNYKPFRVNADIPDRERWMGALCKCKDSQMLAEDSKHASYLYAGACAWVAKDGKTSRYVAELRFIIKLYNLQKLDEIWLTQNY